MLAQLESFVAVARRGSVTETARDLFITQPALTARLNALERALGVTLLARRRSGARLTPAGRAFLPYAERALAAVADGRQLLAALDRGSTGQVSIGASPAVSTYALPPLLRRFSADHPGVELAVRTGHSEEVLDLVKRGEVEVGLTRLLRDPEIESFPLYEDELVLVVAYGHRFVASGWVRLEQLGEESFVLFDRSSSYHELTGALFRDAGIAPRGSMELDNIDSAKKMVELGLGIALLPQIAVAGELAQGRLHRIRIVEGAPPRRPIVAIRRRDAPPPAGAGAAFLALLHEMGPELQHEASAPSG
ncbi:MAG: LysR family transcriptional regulator [Gaiellaceae bacterium]